MNKRVSKILRWSSLPLCMAAVGIMAVSSMPAKAAEGQTLAFVMTSMGQLLGIEAKPENCPNGYSPPPDPEGALKHMSPAMAEKFANPDNVQLLIEALANRGPNGENICNQPWLVKEGDPDTEFALAEPKTGLGFNLDGWDGKGAPPTGIKKHRNLIGLNGEKGIDNQYAVVYGCSPGWLPNAYMQQYLDDIMQNGPNALILQISGIDDMKNDDDVELTFVVALDGMKKNAAGDAILPDTTFRIPNDPKAAVRVHAKIVDGKIVSKEKEFKLPPGAGFTVMKSVQMSFEIKDGKLTGYIGGYVPWQEAYMGGGLVRFIGNANAMSRGVESFNGPFRCPGMWYALKNNADAGCNEKGEECKLISQTAGFKGVSAFTVMEKPTATTTASAGE